MSQRVVTPKTSRDTASFEAENATLKSQVTTLTAQREQLAQQVEWFKRQLFGRKSERRLVEPNPDQPLLNGFETEPSAATDVATETVTYQRRKPKHRDDSCVTEQGLRFDASVPIETIQLAVPEAQAGAFDSIGEDITYRLAQRPGSYVILKYIRPVVKRRSDGRMLTVPAPDSLWPGSMVDVSVIAGVLVDKFAYHLPLYRQHQRLAMSGITVSRSSLTHWVHKASALLKPIYLELLRHILQSKTLAMDETPIKAGRSGKGKMNAAWYWPIYGEADEIAFTFAKTKARSHIDTTLKGFKGTLLTDGAAAYARFALDHDDVVHAQCWAHTRRNFEKALTSEPQGAAQGLELIGNLYAIEKTIGDQKMDAETTQHIRMLQALPAVDSFFAWVDEQRHRMDLLPSQPFAKALAYAGEREAALRVYLSDPTVAIDTNHLERALRPIPMGRKNWMFCWTEVGAEHVGIIQSLICTCRLHDINPYTYLVDVLQRIAIHPDSDIEQLTPRAWKTLFADDPLRSDLAVVTAPQSRLQDVAV